MKPGIKLKTILKEQGEAQLGKIGKIVTGAAALGGTLLGSALMHKALQPVEKKVLDKKTEKLKKQGVLPSSYQYKEEGLGKQVVKAIALGVPAAAGFEALSTFQRVKNYEKEQRLAKKLSSQPEIKVKPIKEASKASLIKKIGKGLIIPASVFAANVASDTLSDEAKDVAQPYVHKARVKLFGKAKEEYEKKKPVVKKLLQRH